MSPSTRETKLPELLAPLPVPPKVVFQLPYPNRLTLVPEFKGRAPFLLSKRIIASASSRCVNDAASAVAASAFSLVASLLPFISPFNSPAYGFATLYSTVITSTNAVIKHIRTKAILLGLFIVCPSYIRIRPFFTSLIISS